MQNRKNATSEKDLAASRKLTR